MDNDVRSKLRREVMSSYWADLAPHQQRGALLLLAPALDLLDVAEAMAKDESARVASWLARGLLWRATDRERTGFEADEASALRFQFVVVQPWVVAQALA